MKFGKLADGRLHLCPLRGADGHGRLHTNLPKYYETASDRDGWMEVVETERPHGDYEPTYSVEDGKIVQSWVPVAPTPAPVDLDKLRSDVDYIAMMTDVDLEV